MPSIMCVCGNKISYGNIPNPNELLVISDVEYDKYSGVVDTEKLYMQMKSILQCEKCGRLLFFNDGFDHEPLIFYPEK